MKNIEALLQSLLSEHEFLKQMQEKIVENYDILAQNQRQNADNHDLVVNNQAIIIRNQEIIVKNQINIIRNQQHIVQNQVSLDVMLKLQAQILSLLKKLNGQEETLQKIEATIEEMKIVSQQNLRFDFFNKGEPLS